MILNKKNHRFSPIIHFQKSPVEKFQLLILQYICTHPNLQNSPDNY
jgi:hypothetical protein